MPPHSRRSSARHLVLALALASAAGCGGGKSRASSSPPRASFLVVAGDSTFWVESAATGMRVRRSPLLLTQMNGEFHELYVAEDDRSYFDALIVGQRLFRRDLVSGDSTVLLDDTTLSSIAQAYSLTHPNESPLSDDDDVSNDPTTHATSETSLLDALGSFLTFEQRLDIEIAGARDDHATRRGVLDVRDGHTVSVSDLAGVEAARRIHSEGRRLLAVAIDSIRVADDERARRAKDAIPGFIFDSLSFALIDDSGSPAVEFLVPGRGEHAGGYALPLAPVRIPAGPWWDDIRPTLPMPVRQQLQWPGSSYDVVAHEDSSGEWATMAVRQRGHEWPVARVPLPVRRVHRLDGVAAESPRLRALSRAFDESSLYSGEARTASAKAPAIRTAPTFRRASYSRRVQRRHHA
ncbi:MAG: hypothetical protein ABIT38_16875 [Gemmatimonadaceae bacterium]